MPPPSKERRRSPRYGCHGPADFRVHNWYLRRGRILDLCLDGCLLQPNLSTGYRPGDVIDLRFEINHLCFRASCIVRRVNPDNTLGVELLKLSGRNHAQLAELIAELDTSDKLIP
ncbi:MAG: PilZ domain-containing protein [Acidobacteria bacterium]|nr:PilZ domain-containing protein [Acidobacteriota bacterium]